jgi:hypothetical protein
MRLIESENANFHRERWIVERHHPLIPFAEFVLAPSGCIVTTKVGRKVLYPAAMIKEHRSYSRKDGGQAETESAQKRDVFGEYRTGFVNQGIFIEGE